QRFAERLLPSAVAPTAPERLAYSRFLGFHEHRPAAASRPRADATNPPNSDVLDFHAAISALSRYPAAMRALGFVFDLVLPLPAGLQPVGIVRVQPASNEFLPDWQIVFLDTAYNLDTAKGLFTTRTN